MQLNSYTAGVIKNCVCTKHDFGVSCYTWAQAMGFYGGETGEEVERDWDNLRWTTTGQVLSTACRLGAHRTRLFISVRGSNPLTSTRRGWQHGWQVARSVGCAGVSVCIPETRGRRDAALLYFWCFTAITRL